MKPLISFPSLILLLLWTAVFPANAQVNVTQEHNNLSRDGHYIDAAFTPANAANLTRDLNFDGAIRATFTLSRFISRAVRPARW